jgi:hypothetical protein
MRHCDIGYHSCDFVQDLQAQIASLKTAVKMHQGAEKFASDELTKLTLQIDELKATIQAEALRAKLLNTVHQVALKQNTAMLELAETYTGPAWPDDMRKAAGEILLAAKMATKEKKNEEAVGNPWAPNKDYPGKPVLSALGPNEETCVKCGTVKARGYMCSTCFGPRT